MAYLSARSIVPFPPTVSNSRIIINNVQFNLTTLTHYNYTLYQNNTLSNTSSCYLIFLPYIPTLHENGTWTNATSCYSPILPIRARGIAGICFGVLFTSLILCTLVNLSKHGRSSSNRSHWRSSISRKAPWYFLILTSTSGALSSFMAIDVDRDYVPSTALVLQSFLLTLLLPTILVAAWEAARNLAAFQRRLLEVTDPFAHRREKLDTHLTLAFYALNSLFFFLAIPRSWSAVEKQRSPDQVTSIARPTATDSRFKAAGLVAAAALGVMYYKVTVTHGGVRQLSTKLLLVFLLLAVGICYSIASSFIWSISPYNLHVHPGWLYGLGYAPIGLVIVVFSVYGFLEENEDRILAGRNSHDTPTQGKKASWWSKSSGRLVKRARSRRGEHGGEFEMRGPMHRSETGDNNESNSWWWWRQLPAESKTKVILPPPEFRDDSGSEGATSQRSSQTAVSLPSASGGRPQVIRSMLDV